MSSESSILGDTRVGVGEELATVPSESDRETTTTARDEEIAELKRKLASMEADNQRLKKENDRLTANDLNILRVRELFTPNCPIHGSIRLPDIVISFVDTPVFQRLRYIKQLSVCHLVYPGAVHDRFFHSIGTSWLAYRFIKDIKSRQPELTITHVDILCVTLAGLLHDIGHPCFSHTFETFMRRNGDQKEWSHEDASIALCDVLFEQQKKTLDDAGFTENDKVFIKELINPPTRKMQRAFDGKDPDHPGESRLHKKWDELIKGRPIEYSWMFEIVSNWRSGIDVDKFDYFRRDAHYLGIHREFEHLRYFDNTRVMRDHKHGSIWTISPSEKEKDCIRENMFETRKELHRAAYQHKTVKKLEMHMLDILKALNDQMGAQGIKTLYDRASNIKEDPESYLTLTDAFIYVKIMESPIELKSQYQKYIVQRNLMRMVAKFQVKPGEDVPVELVCAEKIQKEVIQEYKDNEEKLKKRYPIENEGERDLERELRTEIIKYHYGMQDIDPLDRILWHNKDGSADFLEGDGRPMEQNVFLFWCPPWEWKDKGSQCAFVQRLHLCVNSMLERYSHFVTQNVGPESESKGEPSIKVQRRPKRKLTVQSSCPASLPDHGSPSSPSDRATPNRRVLRRMDPVSSPAHVKMGWHNGMASPSRTSSLARDDDPQSVPSTPGFSTRRSRSLGSASAGGEHGSRLCSPLTSSRRRRSRAMKMGPRGTNE